MCTLVLTVHLCIRCTVWSTTKVSRSSCNNWVSAVYSSVMLINAQSAHPAGQVSGILLCQDQALFEQGEGSFDKELEKAKQAIDNLNSSPLSISEGDNEDDEDTEVVLNTGAYTTKSGRHSIVPDRFSDKR